jgi:hypothetical protein
LAGVAIKLLANGQQTVVDEGKVAAATIFASLLTGGLARSLRSGFIRAENGEGNFPSRVNSGSFYHGFSAAVFWFGPMIVNEPSLFLPGFVIGGISLLLGHLTHWLYGEKKPFLYIVK